MASGLESYVSAKIARTNPLEGGPALEAQLGGTDIMTDTWGGYASRLMEYHQGYYTPEQILGLLGIGDVELADPEVQFVDEYGFSHYWHQRHDVFREEAYEYFRPEQRRLITIVNAIADGYVIENGGSKAEVIQHEIRAASDALREAELPAEAHDAENERLNYLCMQRNALHSGTVISAAEFGAIMLSVNVLNPESPSELASTWLDGVKSAIDDLQNEFSYAKDNNASRAMLGREAFGITVNAIKSSHPDVDKYVAERIAMLRPAFFTIAFKDNPLISGREVR